MYLDGVFECIWKIFVKYISNFKRIVVDLNSIGSVAWEILPLTKWIMTHPHCNAKMPIIAWIYNTNGWGDLLMMIVFKFVLPV